MRRIRLVLALAGLMALVGGSLAFAGSPALQQSGTAADCLGCHENALTPAFKASKHGSLEQNCVKCHEGAEAHAKGQMSGEKAPAPSFKKMTAKQINENCLECHEKGGQANYRASMHDRRNVSCTSCHSVHSPKSAVSQLKTARDAETCFTCHKSERAKSMRTSHHPVREGKMGCSSCHNPHDGSTPKMVKGDSVNELCYSCHTEKRGPFLFEHAPVREDCITCHEPHGTNHKRLLTQKMPNLCWNCHFTGSGHFGSGDNFSTEKGIPVAPTGAPSGFPTVNSRFIEKSCKNCHVNLHGSNSPSGAYFVR